MSKNQAMWATLGCGGVAVLLFLVNAAGCGATFLVPTALFGWIWYVKYDRDLKHVQAAQTFHPHLADPTYATPPKVSKGSGDLYVPTPLDETK